MQKWLRFFPWLQREPSDDTPAPLERPVPDSLPAPYPTALLRRPAPDAFGAPAPCVDAALLRSSLMLAHMTYTLDILPWLQNGWRDFSFQVDDTLESGSLHISAQGDADFLRLANLDRMQRAQHALNNRNPLTRIMAALRQVERSDTVKAVCMMHPLPGGRQLLAIGFMGTGRQPYDWISNMRMGLEDGFHQGFLQLCRRFEQEGENIRFPETALQLGLEKLTLADVLKELRRPDSRFRLWMAGHSQGAAVMQIYTHHLISGQGVHPANLCGVGFASPTVAADGIIPRPWAYPLWHVRNSDDVIGRVGARAHLGRCLDFCADGAFRTRSYQLSGLPAYGECRRWMVPFLASMRDNAGVLLSLTALLICVAQEKGEDVLNAFSDLCRQLPGMARALPAAGSHAQGPVQYLTNRQKRIYREQTGQPMPEKQLAERIDALRPYVRRTPLRRMLAVMAECLLQPHQLSEDDPAAPGAYSLIVREHAHRLAQSRWEVRCGQTVRHVAGRRRPSRRAGVRGRAGLRGRYRR